MRRLSLLAALCAGLLAGCAPRVTPTPAPVGAGAASPAASATHAVTAARPATAVWTATPQPTPTPTASPTATETDTPTDTPTVPPTTTPTQTRLPPTPTFTATPRVEAPVFAQTILHPFEAGHFRNELNELVRFQHQFLTYFRRIVETGEQGNCWNFYQYRNEMIFSQSAYPEVPDQWYGVYYPYRVLIHESVANVQAITEVCDAGGGELPADSDQAILANLEAYVSRAQGLEAQATGIP